MKPTHWILALIAGAAVAGIWHFSQKPASPAAPSSAATPQRAVAGSAATTGAAPTPAAPVPDVPPMPDQVARWIEEAGGADAGKRNAAITALAQAPRDQALPVLRQVLTGGELLDRPQAINSLRELALGQGDADGRVREIIREVIYHGDDEALASLVQDALDVVEESEMK